MDVVGKRECITVEYDFGTSSGFGERQDPRDVRSTKKITLHTYTEKISRRRNLHNGNSYNT